MSFTRPGGRSEGRTYNKPWVGRISCPAKLLARTVIPEFSFRLVSQCVHLIP